MFNLKEYHKILRDYELFEVDGHLLYYGKVNVKDIRTKLLYSLGELRTDNNRFIMRKKYTCRYVNCVSPMCVNWKIRNKIKNSMLSKEDIIAIAEDMDIERIEEIGHTAYLEEYNKFQPEILKVSANDFRAVYAYLKGGKDVS